MKITALISLFLLFAQFANGQRWDYSDIKFEGTVIAELIKVNQNSKDKLKEGSLSKVISFDNRNNLIEDVDRNGLFLRFIYDVNNNVIEQFFFEEIDKKGRRAPSSKWTFHYDKGLIVKTKMFAYLRNKWVLEDSTSHEYSFNSKGQVSEERFLNNKKLVWTRYSSYDDVILPNRLYYHDYLSNLHQPGVIKQVTINAKGDTIHVKAFSNDKNGNIIKYVLSNSESIAGHIKTNKFNDMQLLVEDAQYFEDGTLNYRNTYEYNTKGLIVRKMRYASDNLLKEEVIYNYLQK